MSARGRPARRDSTEQAIVQALRQVGVFVVYVSGDGCPDLLTHFRGRWLPLEVKGKKTRVTAGQIAAQYPICRDVQTALDLVVGTR